MPHILNMLRLPFRHTGKKDVEGFEPSAFRLQFSKLLQSTTLPHVHTSFTHGGTWTLTLMPHILNMLRLPFRHIGRKNRPMQQGGIEPPRIKSTDLQSTAMPLCHCCIKKYLYPTKKKPKNKKSTKSKVKRIF